MIFYNDIFTIARHLICRYSDSITPIKLQLLLYYIKSWSLVAGQPTILESFEARSFGPINPDVELQFERSAYLSKQYTSNHQHLLNQELILFIADSYQIYSEDELLRTVCTETPWKQAFQNFKGFIPIPLNSK